MTQSQAKLISAGTSLNNIQDFSIEMSAPDQDTPIEDRLSSSYHTWPGAVVL